MCVLNNFFVVFLPIYIYSTVFFSKFDGEQVMNFKFNKTNIRTRSLEKNHKYFQKYM